MTTRRQLAAEAKAFRMAKVWTQKQMAAAMNVSEATYIRLEMGRSCSDLTKAKLQRILDTAVPERVSA